MRKLFTDMPLPFKLFVWSFVALMVLLMLGGCDEPTPLEKFELGVVNYGTPDGATNIEIIDNQWYSFEYKGQCFLAMKYWRHAALTKIDCVEE